MNQRHYPNIRKIVFHKYIRLAGQTSVDLVFFGGNYIIYSLKLISIRVYASAALNCSKSHHQNSQLNNKYLFLAIITIVLTALIAITKPTAPSVSFRPYFKAMEPRTICYINQPDHPTLIAQASETSRGGKC